MLDFRDIKDRVTYNDVLSFLALNGKRVGEQFRAKCPACNTDNDRSLVLTPGKGAYCFAAGKGGDILWLVSHVRGIGVRQAAQEIVDHFHLDGQHVPQEPAPPAPTPASKATGNGTASNVPTSLAPLTHLIHEHEACKVFADAKSLGIGFAAKGILRGKLAIPLYRDGKLAGYVGVPTDTELTLPKNLRAQ